MPWVCYPNYGNCTFLSVLWADLDPGLGETPVVSFVALATNRIRCHFISQSFPSTMDQVRCCVQMLVHRHERKTVSLIPISDFGSPPGCRIFYCSKNTFIAVLIDSTSLGSNHFIRMSRLNHVICLFAYCQILVESRSMSSSRVSSFFKK